MCWKHIFLVVRILKNIYSCIANIKKHLENNIGNSHELASGFIRLYFAIISELFQERKTTNYKKRYTLYGIDFLKIC